ncbi:MAG: polysaccharide deacetylase family protein [Armatimonadota bacterium]
MTVPTLLYHDVITSDDWTESGFNEFNAEIYKLREQAFVAHLERLRALGTAPVLLGEVAARGSWRLTFDDGGVSAATVVAPMLDRLGWSAFLFVATGRIGTPGFLDERQIRELAARGHVIGSHTANHPMPMSACSLERLRREWLESVDTLAPILGKRPETASIPGGALTPAVAQAAAEAGIRYLFTSEPVARTWSFHGVTCIGRYTLWRGMNPSVAAACARGRGIWPVRQRLTWATKKVAKRYLGTTYLAVRERVLGGAGHTVPGA